MSRWIRLQLRRGELADGSRLFSAEASRTMWSAHTSIQITEQGRKRYPSTHFRAYGLGWGLMDFLSHKIVTHGGGFDGMFSRVALVPEEKMRLLRMMKTTPAARLR